MPGDFDSNNFKPREKAVSISYPLSNGRPRYSSGAHRPPKAIIEEIIGEPEHRPQGYRMSRLAVILTTISAFLLLITGGSIYRERWTPFGMYGDEMEEDPAKHLVIASYTGQNVSWLDEIPSDWTPYRYFLDDPAPTNGLSVPRNQGREAMAYLTYIIENYDTLPAYMVFTHGHRQSWHQVEPLPMKIRALNLTALQRENYISLRCGDQMGCERVPYTDTLNVNWPGEEGMRDFWKVIMPSEELPRNISYKCCAQHAVTRKAVRRRSKEDWVRVRAPLLGELDTLTMIPHVAFTPQWVVGAWYEKFWHVLFGVGGEYCPSVEYCNQVHFSNAIACDQSTDFHMDDGDAWNDTVCVSAFDDLFPDEPANLTAFDIIDVGARLHRERRDRKKKERDDETRRIGRLQKALMVEKARATAKAQAQAQAKKGGVRDWVKGMVEGGRWSDDEAEPQRPGPGPAGPAKYTESDAPEDDLEDEEAELASPDTGYKEVAADARKLPPRREDKPWWHVV